MIRLRTLGGVDLRDASGREIRGLLAQPKRVALLIYLALAAGSGYRRRDKVIALFWPELDNEHARGALRQALSFLRRMLGEGVIISRGEDEVGVDRSLLTCDALDVAAAESDEAVMAAYQGHFLDGFHTSDVDTELQSWIEEERLRLRQLAAASAWSLADRARASGSPREAATFARQAASLTPDNETETRRLIAWLDELGDRAGAIAVYGEFAARLERDFDAHPAPETQALIGRIRARRESASATVDSTESGSPDLTTRDPLSRAPATSTTPRPAAVGRRTKGMIGAAAALALLVVFVATRNVLTSSGRPSDSLRLPVVAVLPLRDLSPDTSIRYVSEGLTDELITGLAQGKAMRVINSRTMLSYRSSTLTPDAIARELNADVLVFGNLQYIGDTVHLTIQLTRPGEPGALFARSFSGTRGELLGMQRDIAQTLVRQITGDQISNADAGYSVAHIANSEAEELYLRGRHYWNKRGEANLLRSISLFNHAIDVDPFFALAYSGIADAYVQLGYGSLLKPSDAFLKAEAAAFKALDLDSTLAEPHAGLGFVNLYYHWDWKKAEAEFKRSIALNPSYATAHEWYGLFLAAMGRFDEALQSESRAMELDPLSTAIIGTAAWVKYYAGRSDDARGDLEVALRMDPAFALGHFYLGRVLQEQGMLDSAIAQFAATGPLRDWIPTVAAEGYVHAQLARQHEAEDAIARMDSASKSRYVTSYAVALVHAGLGRRGKTFELLRKAVNERTHWLVWLNRDPRWDPVRQDPEFAELVRTVGLPP